MVPECAAFPTPGLGSGVEPTACFLFFRGVLYAVGGYDTGLCVVTAHGLRAILSFLRSAFRASQHVGSKNVRDVVK